MQEKSTRPARKHPSQVAASSAPPPPSAVVACAGFLWSGQQGGLVRPVWQTPGGGSGATMIDLQKGRNNYYKMDVRTQVSMCRRMSERNWFLRPVIRLRHASWCEGFAALGKDGKSMHEQYAFADLVEDILHERLVSSNVVCLWRKGSKLPTITVLDAEAVEYKSVGGREQIKIQYAQDQEMAKDKQNEAAYREILGNEVYEAMVKGKKVTIIKGVHEDWDFETLIDGKRRGVFCIPEMVPVLDVIDFVELMGIGDWNLAWFRKDVIRVVKKGYPDNHGSGAGVNSVDITDPEIKELGEGFGTKINGLATVPANHDVNPSYLTLGPENFDPKQMESSMDKLLHYGGIEAVVLFGSFSQQNGASPSLMRNARTAAFAVREKVERLLRRIFSAPEFSSLNVKDMRFTWGVKSLYSMDELLSLVKATAEGTASPQTRRALLGLDDETESSLMEQAHQNRPAYTPPFEPGQALLPAVFPELRTEAAAAPTATPSAPGRPATPAET